MSSDILKYHQWCISDPVAMPAYEQAIRRLVKPGDVVFDLGAGTGILSCLACKAGAERSYAVDPDQIIGLVPKVAAQNGFGERIIARKSDSFGFDPPEKADVVIASMLSLAGIGNNMLAAVLDARQRLLKPGGIIIPSILVPVVCPVEVPEWYEARIDCWDHKRMDLDFRAVRTVAVNRCGRTKLSANSLLAAPQEMAVIRLAEISSPSVRKRMRFLIERKGVLHALGAWVEVVMVERVRCSSSPVAETAMRWSQMILPLETPIAVQAGDQVTALIRADAVGHEQNISWDVEVRAADGTRRGGSRHSTFFGLLLTKEDLSENCEVAAPEIK